MRKCLECGSELGNDYAIINHNCPAPEMKEEGEGDE